MHLQAVALRTMQVELFHETMRGPLFKKINKRTKTQQQNTYMVTVHSSLGHIYISADPCRQQGERVREEITSNKCCAVQARGKRGGDRKGSQVQSKKPKKGSEKGGAVSANVAGQARGGQKGKPGAE